MTPEQEAADVLDSLRTAGGPVTAAWLAEECGLSAPVVRRILTASAHAARVPVDRGWPRWVWTSAPIPHASSGSEAQRWRERSVLSLLPAGMDRLVVTLGRDAALQALGALQARGEVREVGDVWVTRSWSPWQRAQRRAVAAALRAGIAPGEVATWTGLAPHVARAWMTVLKH